MTDLESIYAAVVANPWDDTPRMIYAEALEDQGDPTDYTYAAFIRAQINLANLDIRPMVIIRPEEVLGSVEDQGLRLQRNDKLFIREEIRGRVLEDSAWLDLVNTQIDWTGIDGTGSHTGAGYLKSLDYLPVQDRSRTAMHGLDFQLEARIVLNNTPPISPELRIEHAALSSEIKQLWTDVVKITGERSLACYFLDLVGPIYSNSKGHLFCEGVDKNLTWVVSRGFVTRVLCSWDRFRMYEKELAKFPLTHVYLTNTPPLEGRVYPYITAESLKKRIKDKLAVAYPQLEFSFPTHPIFDLRSLPLPIVNQDLQFDLRAIEDAPPPIRPPRKRPRRPSA